MLPADLRRLRSLSLMWEDGRAGGQVSYKKRAKSWNKDGTYDLLWWLQLLWQKRVAAAAVADVVIG